MQTNTQNAGQRFRAGEAQCEAQQRILTNEEATIITGGSDSDVAKVLQPLQDAYDSVARWWNGIR